MNMAWFVPVGLAVGLAGTRTALSSRHFLKSSHQESTWWLLAVLAWLPTFCWILAQFVVQD